MAWSRFVGMEEPVRIRFVRCTLALVVILCGRMAAAAEVKVEQGRLVGTVEEGLTVYRGIPFAAPPVGDLRWKAPQPPAKWEGVRNAAEFGRACMQINQAISNLPAPSEDCLYLNVWTPAKAANERLAVMVWIHGGGFTAGTPPERLYHGEALAKKGVIVVSLAYRLGVFGFMAHPGLSAENGKHVSGNYGLLDMIAGLQWVQKNIAAFGGDPGRVTIFGESAGSSAVSQLCGSPLAKGLFQAAMAESGAAFGLVGTSGVPGETMQPLSAAEKAGASFAATVGAATLADLRKMPGDKVLEASQGQRPLNRPILDGYVIAGDLYGLYSTGRYNDVPVLIGYNSDEGISSASTLTSRDSYLSSLQRYGSVADKLLAAYPWGEGAAKKTARDMFRDTSVGWVTWTWARLQTKTGKSKVYLYYFDQHPSYPADSPQYGYGSAHAAEVPFVFNHFISRNRPQPTPEDLKLSDMMMTYWTNFAKNHDPNGPGLPTWPAFNEAKPQTMILTTTPKAAPVPSENGLKVLDEYFAWRRQANEDAAKPSPAK